MNTLETIHESLINGQREQAVRQITEYGPEFFKDFRYYLIDVCATTDAQYKYYADAAEAFHRITGEQS